MFWLVALLCVLYYSAIFPFQRYAPNFLEVTLGIDAQSAAQLFSCFPILAMVLTPSSGRCSTSAARAPRCSWSAPSS